MGTVTSEWNMQPWVRIGRPAAACLFLAEAESPMCAAGRWQLRARVWSALQQWKASDLRHCSRAEVRIRPLVSYRIMAFRKLAGGCHKSTTWV